MPKHAKKPKRSTSISKPALNSSGRPAKIKKVKEVLFDEAARKEFLTGFSKRKKARESAVRNKAIEREKDELRQMRQGIREERRERAARNVRNARALYGDAGSGDEEGDDSGSDSDQDEDEDGEPEPTTFESSELVTTVAIEPFSLSRSPTPEPTPIAPDASTAALPTKGPHAATAPKAHKRRIKNKPAARLKMTREDKKERAKGSKKVKAKYGKQGVGTKGRSNKG